MVVPLVSKVVPRIHSRLSFATSWVISMEEDLMEMSTTSSHSKDKLIIGRPATALIEWLKSLLLGLLHSRRCCIAEMSLCVHERLMPR
jgi:hypothetical protein